MPDFDPPFYALIAQTLIFIAVWAALDRYVTLTGPISYARLLTSINSRLYSFASLILLYLILSPSHEELARYLFHASKFYEYIDILNVRAGGGAIDLHFGFHHLTTPYFTFFRVLQHSEGWRLIAGINTFHHVLMYAYFGGASFLRPILDVTGSAQLVTGLGGDLWILRQKIQAGNETLWPNIFGIGLFFTYLCLWVRDIKIRREGKAPRKRSRSPLSKPSGSEISGLSDFVH